MEHSISAPKERVLRVTQLAKLSYNHSSVVLTADVFQCFNKNIEKHQLWVRPVGVWNLTLQAAWHVRHAHWARLCYVPFAIWWLRITPTKWLLILSSTSFMIGRSRVLYLFLMKDVGRWLPLVLPGSTGRFYKDDAVHNHSVHGLEKDNWSHRTYL